MKTYKIELFTKFGMKTEFYQSTEPLEKFEERMTEKYGTFICQSSNEVETEIQN